MAAFVWDLVYEAILLMTNLKSRSDTGKPCREKLNLGNLISTYIRSGSTRFIGVSRMQRAAIPRLLSCPCLKGMQFDCL